MNNNKGRKTGIERGGKGGDKISSLSFLLYLLFINKSLFGSGSKKVQPAMIKLTGRWALTRITCASSSLFLFAHDLRSWSWRVE